MTATTILRLPEVLSRTGLSRSTIYEMIRRYEFPRQISLGARAIGWSDQDVGIWIEEKIRQSRPESSY